MNYDAIIIGGRVAGASTAMLLARRGYRVLVVDRAKFPSDTISTHIVWQRGIACLHEWGLSDRLAALGAPPLRTMEFDVGPFSLAGELPAVGPAKSAYAPRRTRLDPMLIEAAAASGAEVREGFSVEELVFDGGRVAGIRGRGRSGSTAVERARIVIGADGVHSITARMVKAAEYNTHPRLACWYYSYWSGIRNDRLRFFSRPGSVFGCVPTNDGLACIAAGWPHHRFAEVKADLERHYLGALDAAPAFKQEVLAGRREERIYGTADIPNYFRKPYGPGWALVGDAGYHKDPVMAQGISDAFRHASLLAASLDDVFAGRALWDQAMSGYETARNSAVEAIYGMNAQLAAMQPPDREMQELFEALRDNREDTGRFLGTMTGAVPAGEFHAPENVRRILDLANGRRRAVSAA